MTELVCVSRVLDIIGKFKTKRKHDMPNLCLVCNESFVSFRRFESTHNWKTFQA